MFPWICFLLSSAFANFSWTRHSSLQESKYSHCRTHCLHINTGSIYSWLLCHFLVLPVSWMLPCHKQSKLKRGFLGILWDFFILLNIVKKKNWPILGIYILVVSWRTRAVTLWYHFSLPTPNFVYLYLNSLGKVPCIFPRVHGNVTE